VLLRLASQLRVDCAVPELLHSLPIFNLTASYDILEIMRFLVQESLVTNVVVKFRVGKVLTLSS
jgi:hypothetical protein